MRRRLRPNCIWANSSLKIGAGGDPFAGSESNIPPGGDDDLRVVVGGTLKIGASLEIDLMGVALGRGRDRGMSIGRQGDRILASPRSCPQPHDAPRLAGDEESQRTPAIRT